MRYCSIGCGEDEPSSATRLLDVCSPSTLWVCGWMLSSYQWSKGLIFIFWFTVHKYFEPHQLGELSYLLLKYCVYNVCLAPCEQWTRKSVWASVVYKPSVGRKWTGWEGSVADRVLPGLWEVETVGDLDLSSGNSGVHSRDSLYEAWLCEEK